MPLTTKKIPMWIEKVVESELNARLSNDKSSVLPTTPHDCLSPMSTFNTLMRCLFI